MKTLITRICPMCWRGYLTTPVNGTETCGSMCGSLLRGLRRADPAAALRREACRAELEAVAARYGYVGLPRDGGL